MKVKLEPISELIQRLDLMPHDEGGWFRETYRSASLVSCPDRPGNERSALTVIHYLLDRNTGRSLLHRNRSDIVHFHEGGGVLRYVTLASHGQLSEHYIGRGFDRQLIVPGGVWKASELVDEEWAMVGEAVTPGFDYRDRDIAEKNWLLANFPQHSDALLRFLPQEGSCS